jgi:hypothetical protein
MVVEDGQVRRHPLGQPGANRHDEVLDSFGRPAGLGLQLSELFGRLPPRQWAWVCFVR